jgi:hypothetical protein
MPQKGRPKFIIELKEQRYTIFNDSRDMQGLMILIAWQAILSFGRMPSK